MLSFGMAIRRDDLKTTGVLLAGGSATRLGGVDKGLLDLSGQSLLSRAIARIAPQCNELILSANGEAARFSSFSIAVIADTVFGRPGPLGGVLAALDYVALRNDAEWLVSAPVDCPFLPRDLVRHLHRACQSEQTKVAVARSAGVVHPIVALWHVSLRADLRFALIGEDVRKARSFVARHRHAIVDWPDQPIDPFFNVNTRDDLKRAGQIAASGDSNKV